MNNRQCIFKKTRNNNKNERTEEQEEEEVKESTAKKKTKRNDAAANIFRILISHLELNSCSLVVVLLASGSDSATCNAIASATITQ